MPAPDHSADDGVLERLTDTAYRLMVLSTGSSAAAEATLVNVYRTLPRSISEEELLRRIAPDRRATTAWKLTPTFEQAQRAALREEQLRAVAQVLRSFTPSERFLLGLRVLRGMSPASIASFAGPASTGLFARFHYAIGRALGLLPADADEALVTRIDSWLDGMLSEADALELRRSLLADAQTTALRDGVAASRDTLARAVSALAGAGAPPALLAQLFQHAAPLQTPRRRIPVVPALLLIGAVLAVALVVIIGPTLFRSGQPTGNVSSDPAALVEGAIRRFEQPRQSSGVLHERYRVNIPDEQPIIIERWYDYASPNRLAIDVTRAEQQTEPLYRFATDGVTLAQYRGERVRARDVRLTATDATQLAPLFRAQPFPNALGSLPLDIGRVYLGAARNATLTDLGQSVYQGRAATVVGYMTEDAITANEDATPKQVLLTIDTATASLLEVAVIPRTEGETTAYFPFKSDVFEILSDVSDDRFRFARTATTTNANALGSLSASWFRSRDILSIEEAASRPQLFLPTFTPEPGMRGILGDMARSTSAAHAVGQLYEGEYSSLTILPGEILGELAQQPPGIERNGIHIYNVDTIFGQPFIAGALVEMPDMTKLLVVITDAYASRGERQQKLDAVIDSLRPVTLADVNAVEGWFAKGNASSSE